MAVTASDNFGTTVSAVLTVTCVLGEDVPAGAEEGITALIPGGVSFDESVSGNTLFVQQFEDSPHAPLATDHTNVGGWRIDNSA